jgi:hypothetical protein
MITSKNFKQDPTCHGYFQFTITNAFGLSTAVEKLIQEIKFIKIAGPLYRDMNLPYSIPMVHPFIVHRRRHQALGKEVKDMTDTEKGTQRPTTTTRAKYY